MDILDEKLKWLNRSELEMLSDKSLSLHEREKFSESLRTVNTAWNKVCFGNYSDTFFRFIDLLQKWDHITALLFLNFLNRTAKTLYNIIFRCTSLKINNFCIYFIRCLLSFFLSFLVLSFSLSLYSGRTYRIIYFPFSYNCRGNHPVVVQK